MLYKGTRKMSRPLLYRLSKYFAAITGVQPPTWRTSTIASLQQFNAQQNEINQNRININYTRLLRINRPCLIYKILSQSIGVNTHQTM